jgi:hypothetical protein
MGVYGKTRWRAWCRSKRSRPAWRIAANTLGIERLMLYRYGRK